MLKAYDKILLICNKGRMYEKDFAAWHRLKSRLHHQHHEPTFKEREIWWCSVGVNIGHELDGKNEFFDRPVLVLRKFSKQLFWGVPLSSRIKDNPHYYIFSFNGKDQAALLTHMRLYDSKRMTDKMGKLSHNQFKAIQLELANRILRK